MSSLLDKALEIAVRAHSGQKDRYGEPYILHPLRVMHRVKGEARQVAAILHDVVEDTPVTLADLRKEGFPPAIVQAVDALTKRKGEPYESLIERAAADPIARDVKLADLEDNMDLRRVTEVQESDLPRFRKYLGAWQKLSALRQTSA